MRKIILFMHISLNGIVAGPNGSLDWANMSEDSIGGYMIPDLLKTTDALLLGRNLYEGFQQYWPAVAKDSTQPAGMVEFARWMDDAPKFVVSSQPRTLDWQHSILIVAKSDDDLTREINALKQTTGGDIVIFGGARLSQSLARLDLVDEYRLKLEAAAVGGGVPLFDDLGSTRKFKLIKSKAFDPGVVMLYYEPLTLTMK